jgi:hypothetical protein
MGMNDLGCEENLSNRKRIGVGGPYSRNPGNYANIWFKYPRRRNDFGGAQMKMGVNINS